MKLGKGRGLRKKAREENVGNEFSVFCCNDDYLSGIPEDHGAMYTKPIITLSELRVVGGEPIYEQPEFSVCTLL